MQPAPKSPLPSPALATLAAAESAYGRRDYQRALELLVSLLRRAPDLPPATQLLGTTYFRLHRYDDAADAFERFLTHAPTEVWRVQAYGHSLFELGRFDAARSIYERVLAARPEHTQRTQTESVGPLRGLALIHLANGDTERAVALLESALSIAPDDPAVLESLASAWWDAFEPERALAFAQAACDAAPHRPKPWFLLSRIHADLEEQELADRCLVRWRELDRLAQSIRAVGNRLLFEADDPELWMQLCELRAQSGDGQRAADAFDAALERHSPSTSTSASRADLYHRAATAMVVLDGPWIGVLAERFASEFPEDPRTSVWMRRAQAGR